MKERIKSLIQPMIYIAAGVFIACCFLIKKPESIDDYLSYIGYAISAVSVLFVLYERILWRYIPWNRPPVLKKEYQGSISYVYKKEPGTKQISVGVKQSLFSVQISVSTDINTSYSLTGNIVNEHDVDVLYYNYVTEPSAVTQEKNPIQHGTCRMVLNNDNSAIKGKYWTSSKTTGDIEWHVPEERHE